MRRLLSKVLVVAFTLSFGAQLLPASSAEAQTTPPTDPSIWSENIDIVDEGAISEAEASQDPQCTSVSLRRRVYNGILLTLPNGKKLHPYGSTATVDAGEGCAVSNKLGSFANGLYAPSGNLSNSLKLNRTSVSYLPAPASEFVIKKVRSSSSGLHAISISSNLQNGELTYKKVNSLSYDLTWTPKNPTNSIRFALNGVPSSGPRVTAKDIAFSRNGKFMIAKLAAGVFARVDLRTQAMTPVYRSLEKSNGGTKTAISNDGRYAFTGNSKEVFLHDIASCDITYQKGYWELNQDMASYGCDKTENLKRPIQAKTSRASRGFVYPQFSLNSSELSYVDQRSSSQNHRISLRANDYVSSAEGYLALGDSFSAGEGDTQGGTWYEPGTDEQGEKGTFAGRNLCHLSRRSYPYLMAVELGYLATNSTTPPSDGLFHSVACSGAKIHNIVGGSGVIDYDAAEREFDTSDNQYRSLSSGTALDLYQPGYRSQLSFFKDEIVRDRLRNEIEPEIITVGIGGNDADFGGFLQSCMLPGTCAHAQPNSYEANQLGLRIAQQKNRLVDTYNQLKIEAPDARIYAHGYPVFINDEDDVIDDASEIVNHFSLFGFNPIVDLVKSCAPNVLLNLQERRAAVNGILFMNHVVKAAAAEAGVFYIDVENVLEGERLCDRTGLISGQGLAVNGVSPGNDIINICPWTSGCVGNETFHPNQKAQILYKDAILAQTNQLNAQLPDPFKTSIPLPPSNLFGSQVSQYVIGLNQLNNPYSNSLLISNPRRFIQTEDTRHREIGINQGGYMPATNLEVSIRSVPTDLGTYTVGDDGVFSKTIELPDGFPGGSHTVYLRGVDNFGEEVLHYEQIFIAMSENDFDGDGVLDIEDSCKIIPNLKIDLDEDTIDDACDNDIALSTAAINTSEIPDRGSDENNSSQENTESSRDNSATVLGVNTSLSDTGSNTIYFIFTGIVINLAALIISRKAD